MTCSLIRPSGKLTGFCSVSLSANFFDEKTKKELSDNLEKLRIELTKNKKAISMKSFKKAWKNYKDEGGALSSKK